MAYTPTTWASGDVVTAQKMNKLEQGVASGSCLVVTATRSGSTWTLDKTAGEIYQAFTSGMTVLVTHTDNYDGTDVYFHHILVQCWMVDGNTDYRFYFSDFHDFTAESSSSYPSYENQIIS